MKNGKEKMEQQEEKSTVFSIFKKIEGDIVKWFFGTVCTMICLAIPFYYHTTDTLEDHGQKISYVQTDVKELKITVTALDKNPAFNSDQVTAIKKIVEDIKCRQERLEERQDKMYDLILQTLQAKK